VSTDGAITCWGDNVFGEGTVPNAVSSGNVGRQVSVGTISNVCVLRANGSLQCWRDSQGAVAGTFTQASASLDFDCAVQRDGIANCWGYNTQQLPDFSKIAWLQVSANPHGFCGVRSNGLLVCIGQQFTNNMPTATKYLQVATAPTT